jgi:hypothetical protein
MVRLENPVMHQRVPFKRIPEPPDGAVHDITVQRPFEEGAQNDPGNNSNGAPKKKHGHKQFPALKTEGGLSISARRGWYSNGLAGLIHSRPDPGRRKFYFNIPRAQRRADFSATQDWPEQDRAAPGARRLTIPNHPAFQMTSPALESERAGNHIAGRPPLGMFPPGIVPDIIQDGEQGQQIRGDQIIVPVD